MIVGDAAFAKMTAMIEFAILGSGSSGNSAVVCQGETKILVDAGLSARQLKVRLEKVGIDPDALTAIVLTHEHGDHVQGLEVFCRNRSIPVYGTVHTCHLVQESRIRKAVIKWNQFEAGSAFQVGDLRIESFTVPHDAADPVGYVFRGESASIGVLSDVGHITRLIVDRLKGVDSLFVESNYDEMMLQNDAKRPWSLKQRIANRHGHLSNEQTAALLREIATPELNRVVLGHLSSDCNTAEKALSFAKSALEEMGLHGVAVDCAERKEPTLLFSATDANVIPFPIAADRTEASQQPAPLDEEIAAAARSSLGDHELSEDPAARAVGNLVEAKLSASHHKPVGNAGADADLPIERDGENPPSSSPPKVEEPAASARYEARTKPNADPLDDVELVQLELAF